MVLRSICWLRSYLSASLTCVSGIQIVRQLEARFGAAASGVTKGLGLTLPGSSSTDEDTLKATQLVEETIALIETTWLDARGSGFDRVAWRALCDDALSHPPRNAFEAHSLIRYLLARGPQDPYTRFLTPSEFKSMTAYDVTGVGLNLGTGEEFVRKTGMSLPPGRESEQRSVFVVGVMKGTSAVLAGVRQGDEILSVNSKDVTQLSPFETASLIAGPQARIQPI